MQNIDLTNAGFLTQGPGLATLTAGTEAGAITTLIKGMTDFAVSSDTAYGVGGAKLQKFSSTAVTNTGAWPHTIDKGAVTGEDGEDVAYYQGNLYYTYNHSGSVGDIGKYDLNATFDDDWGSTVPTGMGALSSNPHPMVAGGDDILYIANGNGLGTYNGDTNTLNTAALDLPTNSVVVDVVWNADRVWAATNRPNTSGTNKNTASIYIWDGSATSWETEVKVMGTLGALFVKNGTVFCFYQDVSSSGGYKLGYVNGGAISDLANFTGSLPLYYQVSEFKDFIIWISNGLVWAFGAGDKDLPARLFQLADGGFSTVGGLACPFGNPIIASNQSTSYKLAQFSGYDTACNWKSLVFDITKGLRESKIKSACITFEALAANARVDWKLLDNQGRTIYSDVISHTKLGAVTKAYYPLNGLLAENFRVEFDFTSGNATNPVKIKSVVVYGEAN